MIVITATQKPKILLDWFVTKSQLLVTGPVVTLLRLEDVLQKLRDGRISCVNRAACFKLSECVDASDVRPLVLAVRNVHRALTH